MPKNELNFLEIIDPDLNGIPGRVNSFDQDDGRVDYQQLGARFLPPPDYPGAAELRNLIGDPRREKFSGEDRKRKKETKKKRKKKKNGGKEKRKKNHQNKN